MEEEDSTLDCTVVVLTFRIKCIAVQLQFVQRQQIQMLAASIHGENNSLHV